MANFVSSRGGKRVEVEPKTDEDSSEEEEEFQQIEKRLENESYISPDKHAEKENGGNDLIKEKSMNENAPQKDGASDLALTRGIILVE